ncbi:hypothetical protein UPYG_G00331980 [Umbra pygmaea]|uniref:Fucolectin tachylectin-4 pentraxin-1 domain-containing protein n=1 Tax=Umbra pygmaea TaxID=75934 RepID=A0ABD0VWW3_UMBPY
MPQGDNTRRNRRHLQIVNQESNDTLTQSPEVSALLGSMASATSPTQTDSETANLALKGVAAQSSLFENCIASRAIDGDRQTFHPHCTHNQKEINPWWRVDLRDVYRVRSVSITNRGDCCAERLDGAEIRIGDSLKKNGVMNPR